MKSLRLMAALLMMLALSGHTEPTASADVNTHADWKIYTNAKYGFEFHYPPTYQIQEKFKLSDVTVFSRDINTGLFAVGLTQKGHYKGFSVVAVKKVAILFRSKALTGFYKYEPNLNTWLGYNFVSAEYDAPRKRYFYLGAPLCDYVDELGPDKIPSYGTGRNVEKEQPRNDVVLTNQPFAFELPRENPDKDHPADIELAQLQDQIRDTFRVLDPVKPLQADCSMAALSIDTTTLPSWVEPSTGQPIDFKKPVHVVLSKPLPAAIGAVFYANASMSPDLEKMVYDAPLGDLATGLKITLHSAKAGTETPLPPVAIHLCFYKAVSGRKILLGKEACISQPISTAP